MNVPLIVAGSLAILGAAIHGVAGEVLVEDGRLTHLDVEEIRRRAGEELAKLLARSGAVF